MRSSDILRALAPISLIKGAFVLTIGVGLLFLDHGDVGRFLQWLSMRLHANGTGGHSVMLLELVENLTDDRMRLLELGTFAYAGIRFLEAVGLWYAYSWGSWIAALSGLVYLPFEAIDLTEHVTPIALSVLVCNIFVVSFLVYRQLRCKTAKGDPVLERILAHSRYSKPSHARPTRCVPEANERL